MAKALGPILAERPRWDELVGGELPNRRSGDCLTPPNHERRISRLGRSMLARSLREAERSCGACCKVPSDRLVRVRVQIFPHDSLSPPLNTIPSTYRISPSRLPHDRSTRVRRFSDPHTLPA
jgi:hypothetical protein